MNFAAIEQAARTSDGLGALVDGHPFLALAVAAILGLLTSVGPCTLAKAMAFAGFMGRQEDRSPRSNLLMSMAMNAGVATSFAAMGLVVGLAADLTSIAERIFVVAGVLILLFGLSTAGLFALRLPLPASVQRLVTRQARRGGPAGSYVLGTGFGLMLCPCCLPGLVAIFALTFAQGRMLFGLAMVLAFATGHNVPVIAAGAFAGGVTGLQRLKPWRDLIDVAMGSILVISGSIMLWVS